MPERSAKQGPLENNRNSFSWRRAPYRSASASSSLEMCSRVGCGDQSHWRREVEGMKTIQLVSPQADLCGCAGKLAYCGPFELIILLFHKLRAELRVFFCFWLFKVVAVCKSLFCVAVSWYKHGVGVPAVFFTGCVIVGKSHSFSCILCVIPAKIGDNDGSFTELL